MARSSGSYKGLTMTDITQLAREAGFIQAGQFLSGDTSLVGNEKDFAKLEQLLRDKFIAELGEPVAWLRFRAAQCMSSDGYVETDEWLEVCEIFEIGDDRREAIPVYALKDERK